MKPLCKPLVVALGLGLASPSLMAAAIRDTALFSDNTLLPYDDNNSGSVSSFIVDLFGTTAQSLSVNSNGAVTHGNLWPINFNQLSQNTPILAPFFANIDNRQGGLIQWGFDVIDGHQVLGAQWLGVSGYGAAPDKTNSFQIIITQRWDQGAGAFDFEFNYDSITWDTTAHAWWDSNPSPDIARAGWYNSQTGVGFEFAGSGVAGALLDDNLDTGLIHHSRNSDVLGRYVFEVRNGQVLPAAPAAVPLPAALPLMCGGLGVMGTLLRRRGARA